MKKIVLSATVLLGMFFVSSCGEKSNKEKLQDAVEEVGEEVEEAAEEVGDESEDLGETIEESAEDAGDKIKEGLGKLKKDNEE